MSTKLVASVRVNTGKTRHYVAGESGIQEISTAISVRIESCDSAFYLFRLDAEGHIVADTWHQTIQEAKAQAAFEYEIQEGDWSVAADPDDNALNTSGTGE